MVSRPVRIDYQAIAAMIRPGSRILDIGCGDGDLLAYLKKEKQVQGRGMELSQAGVNLCVMKGLSVIQGNADTDLDDYPSASVDYAILSQTLQATRQPAQVLRQLVRIGSRAIVSFPNFGHWKIRWRLGIWGKMPETKNLPWRWHDTPNIHLCTIRDFVELAEALGVTVEQALAIGEGGEVAPIRGIWGANLFGEQGLFLLRGKT